MSSDTWSDIQAHKNRQSSLREKLARRKQERQAQIGSLIGPGSSSPVGAGSNSPASSSLTASTITSSQPSTVSVVKSSSALIGSPHHTTDNVSSTKVSSTLSPRPAEAAGIAKPVPQLPGDILNQVEKHLLLMLSDITLVLPMEVSSFVTCVNKQLNRDIPSSTVEDLMHKFATQMLLSLESDPQDVTSLVVSSVDHNKLDAVTNEMEGFEDLHWFSNKRKKESEDQENDKATKKAKKVAGDEDLIESLLSKESAKQKESKKMNDEILQLLSKPTAKEQSLIEKFKSQGGATVKEFCPNGTKEECTKVSLAGQHCDKLHFRKIIKKHTDESLGDCSFLNTCFHMDTCKYVHYEIDYPEHTPKRTDSVVTMNKAKEGSTILFPPQWIQCDLRSFDMMVLGKFAIVMADPPWDIHMELPYGTMSDDEMRKLQVPVLQDEGYIFLWVTGRAMELGRECLQLWGYERMDELIWVKTNQLQRIIRTGRTGHWLNHGKEHCLVGVKGNPKSMNRGLDCDVIVAEVRATSHKPDEIYGIIERLSPGTRKIELFGRPHNVQPNWFTLGNQLDGVKLNEPDVVKAFKARYPDGNCLKPSK